MFFVFGILIDFCEFVGLRVCVCVVLRCVLYF